VFTILLYLAAMLLVLEQPTSPGLLEVRPQFIEQVMPRV